MISRILGFINAADRSSVLSIAAGLLIVIALLDYLSGDGLASSIFYLIPVALVGWRFDIRVSGPFALVATLAWVFVTLLLGVQPENLLFATWDGFSRFIVYLIFALLLGHVRRSLDQAREMALTDHLTGLANSRYFQELAERELEHCRRHGRPFTLAYIDIDDFKDVNDKIGHSGGDRVIQSIATALSGSIRRVDHVARQGGDEFMLFLHEVDGEQAEQVLQLIHSRVSQALENQGLDVSLSIGGVTWATAPRSLDAAIHTADRVMYQVKRMEKGAVLHRTIGDPNLALRSDAPPPDGDTLSPSPESSR